MRKIAILGTVGVPANYGGFETLVDNLVYYHGDNQLPCELVVYCSGKTYRDRPARYGSATLRYIPLSANGASSTLYDILSLFHAVWRGADVILLLGVSGALALPLVRLVSKARIVTNIDGIEWKREKWQGVAKSFLRISEKLAVRFSHEVISDNSGIGQHVQNCYGLNSRIIAYGGDHAIEVAPKPWEGELPERYALALCRIEPENNVAMILEAFSRQDELPLVFVGNWASSEYGMSLRQQYADVAHLHLLDPVYDLGRLRTLRDGATLYIHGHSAGGTNPSLVEMMHFGLPILAYDCVFNRFSTDEKALFFRTPAELKALVERSTDQCTSAVGAEMARIAREKYTWSVVGKSYFDLLLDA